MTGQRLRPCHHRLLLTGALLALVGCAQAPQPLYMWEAFARQQYDILLREGASPAEQIQALQAHAEKARAANAALPPGLRAHLGMLQLAVGDTAAARRSFEAEKLAFPESTHYINSLIKRMDSPAAAAKGNPA